jgi:hypothetical protein
MPTTSGRSSGNCAALELNAATAARHDPDGCLDGGVPCAGVPGNIFGICGRVTLQTGAVKKEQWGPPLFRLSSISSPHWVVRLPLLRGGRPTGQAVSRSSRRFTCVADQVVLPRDVGMPFLLSAAAMASRLVAPAACSLAMIGR